MSASTVTTSDPAAGDASADTSTTLTRARLAMAMGALDASVVIAYFLSSGRAVSNVIAGAGEINVTYWHVITIIIKLILTVLYWKQARLPSVGARAFLVSVFILAMLSLTLGNAGNLEQYYQYFGFIVHLSLTLMFVRADNIRAYFRSSAIVIAGSAAVHAALCFTGKMANDWGRFLYFANTQPNLGGEIEAVGAIAAVAGLRPRYAIVCLGLCVLDSLYLQSRAATLTQIMAGGAMIAIQENGRLHVGRIFAMVIAGVAALLGLSLLNTSLPIGDALASVFLLNDAHRGLGSGASGRGELIQFGLELFQASPIIGYPPGYFLDIGYVGPHNFFVYGLAQFGMGFAVVVIILLVEGVRIFRANMFVAYLVLCGLPLLLFNDRLVNLNPYPFIYYVLIFGSITGAAPAISRLPDVQTLIRLPRYRRANM